MKNFNLIACRSISPYWFSIPLMLICCSISASAQKPTETAPKIITSKITPALRSEIEKNRAMQDAIAILTEDGDYIEYREGSVKTTAKEANTVEVYFKILTKVKNRKTEFENLVYSREKDNKITVYFDKKKEVPVNNPQESAQKLFGCGSWSAWQDTGTSCDPRFICFGKGQQATYRLQERTRQCNNGIRRQTRKCFIDCGC